MLRRHDRHVGNTAQIRQIEDPLVRLPIASHQPRPVNRQDYRQILERHVMDKLIIGTLKKGRVHGKYRVDPACRQSRRKGNPVCLGDPHVEETVGIELPKPGKACPVSHGCRDRRHLRAVFRLVTEHLAEHIGTAVLLLGRFRLSRLDLERPDPMKLVRMLLRRFISLTLLCYHMQKHRPVYPPGLSERLAQKRNMMSGNRPQISNSHIFKEHTRYNQLLDTALGLADLPDHRIPHHRNLVQSFRNPLLKSRIDIRCPKPGKISGHSSHILRDRHIVIIQDDNKVRLQRRRVVESFIGHAAGQRSVPDHGDHTVILPLKIPCLNIAKPRRYGGRAVPRVKCIAGALLPLGETAHTSVFAQIVKPVFAPCKKLVCIGLMPHIPDDLVFRKFEDQMHRDRKLHNPQIGRQMSSALADLLDQKFPDLFCQSV